jgi:hypothetical protein
MGGFAAQGPEFHVATRHDADDDIWLTHARIGEMIGLGEIKGLGGHIEPVSSTRRKKLYHHESPQRHISFGLAPAAAAGIIILRTPQPHGIPPPCRTPPTV